MKEIFDSYIDNTFENREQAVFKFDDFEYNYRKYFPSNVAAKLLDIGIGRGEMLSCMKEWGYTDYLGVDISPSTVAFCTSLGLHCLLVEDTVQWLSGRGSIYDVITLLDVLEHIKKEDVIPFLGCLYKALAPGGRIIIQVPNMQAPDAPLHRYNDFTHETGFIENSLRQVMISAGIVNFEFHGFEDAYKRDFRTRVRFHLRNLYWGYTRFLRKVNANLNPPILNPVFLAVVHKVP
jgi:SAM-dependent methyltransferase